MVVMDMEEELQVNHIAAFLSVRMRVPMLAPLLMPLEMLLVMELGHLLRRDSSM